MTSNKTGIVMAVVILLVMGLAVSVILDVPIAKEFKLPTVPAGGPAHVFNTTIYADAQGWNYNHGKLNPTIVIPDNTLVHFTVIEEDNQPHTLTINPGAKESSVSATLLTSSDITQVPGHVSHASAYFSQTGEYTYWCTFHPATMVANIYVNASAGLPSNNTTPTVTYSHWKNMTFDLNNSSLQLNKTSFPTIAIQNSTFLNISVNDSTSATYSVNFSYGAGVNLSNSTAMINSTNASAYGGFYFVKPGLYSYWNYYNTSQYGQIYVYTGRANTTLTANVNGWNYTNGTANTNPTLSFAQYTLVRINLVNGDNLTHSLVINPGNSINPNYTAIANVSPSVSNVTVVVFFYNSGNYTYWDSYHPSTASGLIRVSASNASAGAAPNISQAGFNSNSDIVVIDMMSSHMVKVRMEI